MNWFKTKEKKKALTICQLQGNAYVFSLKTAWQFKVSILE